MLSLQKWSQKLHLEWICDTIGCYAFYASSFPLVLAHSLGFALMISHTHSIRLIAQHIIIVFTWNYSTARTYTISSCRATATANNTGTGKRRSRILRVRRCCFLRADRKPREKYLGGCWKCRDIEKEDQWRALGGWGMPLRSMFLTCVPDLSLASTSMTRILRILEFTMTSSVSAQCTYQQYTLWPIKALKSRSHLLKLSIAHALAQSTLLAHFESNAQRVLSSPQTLAIPQQLAAQGALQLRRHEALKLTGRLFTLRRDVNLVSNVLDVPELFWSEATLKELYDAVREYMEISGRVQVLNEKLGMASDFVSFTLAFYLLAIVLIMRSARSDTRPFE